MWATAAGAHCATISEARRFLQADVRRAEGGAFSAWGTVLAEICDVPIQITYLFKGTCFASVAQVRYSRELPQATAVWVLDSSQDASLSAIKENCNREACEYVTRVHFLLVGDGEVGKTIR